MTKNPVSGITPTRFNLLAEFNKNNYHLLRAYYVPDTMLNAYMRYLLKILTTVPQGRCNSQTPPVGVIPSNLPRPRAIGAGSLSPQPLRSACHGASVSLPIKWG